MTSVCESTAERRWFVSDPEFRCHTKRASRRFRNQESFLLWRLWLCRWITRIFVMLGRVWVRPLDLYEAFRADRLVAASSFVEVRWIIEKADRAF